MAVYGYDFYLKSKYGGKPQVDFGIDPFESRAASFSTVELTWNEPSGNWTGMRILRSRSGYAVNEEDGALVYSQTNTVPTPRRWLDGDLTGGWYYYTVLLYNADNSAWERAAAVDVLVPFDYRSTEKMWDLIPNYYRNIRDTAAGYSQALYEINPQIYLSSDQTAENEQMFHFLHVFGWGMDMLRSQIDTTLDGYDPGRAHLSRLALLADQFGTSLEPSVPARNNRSLVRNLALLYRKRGTIDGIRELLSLATGWDVDVFLGPNLLLNQDQSTFPHPTVRPWSPEVRYVTGDWVVSGQFLYVALQTAYGVSQGPPVTQTDTAFWNATSFKETKETTAINRADTGDVGDWQIVGPTGVLPATTFIGLGVTDPVGGIQATLNCLAFKNPTGSTNDFTVRSIPRYSSAPTVFDRKLVVMSGIPVPRVLIQWDSLVTYHLGDQVLYNGAPFRALNTNVNVVPTTTANWERLGVDKRTQLAMSFYAHGPWDATPGTGGVTVYPYFLFFDKYGDFMQEVLCAPGVSTGLAYDAFNVPGNVTTGRVVSVGSKTWDSVGVGTWNQAANADGGYAYPTAAGRTYQVVNSTIADGSIGVTFKSVGTRQLGIIFRFTDSSNFWLATNTGLHRMQAGVLTSNVATWTAFVVGERMKVTLSGSTITVFKNGVSVGTTSNAFNNTATRHGIIMEA